MFSLKKTVQDKIITPVRDAAYIAWSALVIAIMALFVAVAR